jgi:uncharacterized protein YukE
MLRNGLQNIGGRRWLMAKGNEIALSGEINVGKIRQLQKRIDANSDIVDSIVNRLVSDYCKPLDEYMEFIRNILNDTANPPTDRELDDFTLNIPVLLYFTGEAQEALGVKEDVAKAIKQELYNEIYDKSTGTIADKTAAAELATQNEYIAHIAYQRAYKKVKLRMEAANEMLQSVKKVISRRMVEYEVARVDPGRVGGQ